MSKILRNSQYLGVQWSIYSKSECQRLVALAPRFEKLIEQQLSHLALPAFARQFWSYGHGVMNEDSFRSEKIQNEATISLDRVGKFSRIKQNLSLPRLNWESCDLAKIYDELSSSFNICLIPYSLHSGEIFFWNYGVYAGPPSRFCRKNLSLNEYYLSSSGNNEIDDFIKSVAGESAIELKTEPVIFNSYNRKAITNKEFKEVYSSYLDTNGGDLRSLSLGQNSEFVDFPSIKIKFEEIPQTLLNDQWWQDQEADILLFEYFGGMFYFKRADKKSIIADIMKIKNNPYKPVNELILRVPCYSFQELLGGKLFLGVTAE